MFSFNPNMWEQGRYLLAHGLGGFDGMSMCRIEVVGVSGVMCRRDSVEAAKKHPLRWQAPIHPAIVRRSRRLGPIVGRRGAHQEHSEMEGDEASATTRTSDEYSPGEYTEPAEF